MKPDRPSIHAMSSPRFVRHVLALTFLLLGGCLPYSDQPLTDVDMKIADSSIYGTWYWIDDGDWGYVHIGKNEDQGLVQVFLVEIDNDGELELIELLGHTSLLDEKSYLNLRWVRPDNDTNGYLLAKYAVRSDSLEFSFWDNDVVEKAVRDKSLKGTVTEGRWFNSVQVTESQRTLQKFVLENDERLFKEEQLLHRLELPKSAVRPPLTGSKLSVVLLPAQLRADEILGKWHLISETTYLSMIFSGNGQVAITMGQKNGPLTAPVGKWSLDDGTLRIVSANKVLYEYKDINRKSGYLYATDQRGVVQRFEYTPPN